MPVVLKKYGLEKAVRDLFEKLSNEEVTATIEYWDAFEEDENDNLMLYRIVQELTNNSLKHSGGSEISLSAKDVDGDRLIVFTDNGKGFPNEILEKAEGMGLWNILNRAQTVGASVDFSNQESGGAKVEIRLNLNKALSENP